MSIQSEINRLKQAVDDAFTAIGNKGGTVPASKVSGNLASAIETIPEAPEERLLLLELFPTWIFQFSFFFFWVWQGCWTTLEEKKWSVD